MYTSAVVSETSSMPPRCDVLLTLQRVTKLIWKTEGYIHLGLSCMFNQLMCCGDGWDTGSLPNVWVELDASLKPSWLSIPNFFSGFWRKM